MEKSKNANGKSYKVQMEKSKKDLKPKDFFNFHWIMELIHQKI
jgi:hypothetical protein